MHRAALGVLPPRRSNRRAGVTCDAAGGWRHDLPDALWASRVVFDPAAADAVGWDAEPAGRVSLAWGQTWLLGRASLFASVPSVVVPEEHNVLVNPANPDAARLKASKLRKWIYDGRLT